jgi:Na+/H+ antiporter NhaA
MSPLGEEKQYKSGMRKDPDGFMDIEWCSSKVSCSTECRCAHLAVCMLQRIILAVIAVDDIAVAGVFAAVSAVHKCCILRSSTHSMYCRRLVHCCSPVQLVNNLTFTITSNAAAPCAAYHCDYFTITSHERSSEAWLRTDHYCY